MKKTTILLLAALSGTASAAQPSCEMTDMYLFSENNMGGVAPGVQPIGLLYNVNGNDLAFHAPVYVDGVDTGIYLSSMDDIIFGTSDIIPASIGPEHTIMTELTFKDGTVISCSDTFSVPADNAPPAIIRDNFTTIETTETGSVKVVFQAASMDSDGNLSQENIQYEFLQAPDGVELPTPDFGSETSLSINNQELEFTIPGDYKLRLKAEDDLGEVDYSETFEFTVDGQCIRTSIADHVTAGRAINNNYGSYFSTGAYVYLGYNNSGNTVGLEKIESLGNWWVVCL